MKKLIQTILKTILIATLFTLSAVGTLYMVSYAQSGVGPGGATPLLQKFVDVITVDDITNTISTSGGFKLPDDTIISEKEDLGKWSTSTSNSTDIYYNDGNVGIGTDNPEATLDVAGQVKATELCIGNDCKDNWPSLENTIPSCYWFDYVGNSGGEWPVLECGANEVITAIQCSGNPWWVGCLTIRAKCCPLN